MNILFVITARGGSKGVPGKNIREIAGLPLIVYKIIAAQRCDFNGRIIVSTDDDNIARIAKEYGAEVPFMRPDYLASDTANSMDVVEHALRWVDDNDDHEYEYICLLEPSSPFASPKDLHNALEMIIASGADTLLSMKKVDVSSRFIWPLDEKGGLSYFYNAIYGENKIRRQDQIDEYTMNGCMYIAKTEYFREHKLFHSINSLPYVMPEEKSIEIDDMNQYLFAKYCAENGVIDISEWQ